MEWTKEKQAIIRKDCIGELGLCGCGSGHNYEIVLSLLDRSEKNSASAIGDKVPCFYDPMEGEILSASAAWVEFGANVLDAAGLLEHGSGIGHAWLTDDGRMLLDFLREFGADQHVWPEWATCEVVE